jgi:hypothetical protein
VCDQIQERIPPMLARHKDPMASVTTVLNRLVEYGEAQAVLLNNGRRAWRWIAEAGEHSARASMAAQISLLARFAVTRKAQPTLRLFLF